MFLLPPLTRIFLACGATDMRKGFDGLAVLVHQALQHCRRHCEDRRRLARIALG